MAQGSIYPYTLGDGSTRYLVRYRTSNGVQKQKRGFDGRRDAERFLNKTMAAVDAGNVVATKDTFATYIDRWLKEQRRRLEPGTHRDYAVHVKKRLRPFFGPMKLAEIRSEDVRRYVTELLDGTAAGADNSLQRIGPARLIAERLGTLTAAQLAITLTVPTETARSLIRKMEAEGTLTRDHVATHSDRPGRRPASYRFAGPPREAPPRERAQHISPKTINNSLGVLRVALGHAQEDGLIVANPAASTPGTRDRIKLPNEHRETDFLRLYEIPRYLEACSATYRPLAEVLIACGLRISEALALQWPHVDFDGNALLVLSSRKRGRDGRETNGSTKGDRYRSVEFGPRIQGILRDLRATRTEHGIGDPTVGRVFLGSRGAALNRSDVSRTEHKATLRRAGLRDSLRLHDLRHTAAASWLAVGLPLIYVQRQLGHSSITTTEQQYGHLEKSFLRDAAQRVEAAIWEQRSEVLA